MGRNTPQTFYDQNTDPNILNEIIRKKAWGFTKDEAPFVSFIESLPALEAVKSKKLGYAIGDYFSTKATLGATFNSMTATSITFAASYDFFFEGDIIRLYDTVTDFTAIIRLGTRISAAKYNCTVLTTSDTGAGTAMLVAATTFINVLNSSVNIHGDARPYNNKKGNIGRNWMQRSRDTVGDSDFAGEDFLIDNSKASLIQRAWKYYAKKEELKLLTQDFAFGGIDTSDEFMMSGGLPFFYNPANVAHTDVAGFRSTSADGFNGVNKVVSGTEFTLSDLRNWMCDLTAYGTKNKLFITNDDSYKMIYDLAEKSIGIERTDLRDLDIGLADVNMVNTLSLGFGKAHLMRSKALNDVRMLIKDSTTPGTTSNGQYMIIAVDPAHIGKRAYIDKNGKTKNADMSEIARINHGSIDKTEFDGMGGLEVNEPRSGGFFSITNV